MHACIQTNNDTQQPIPEEMAMKTIRVAAAIIRNDDKILAVQRGYGEFKGGWEFPGGKLEPEESAADACIREIQEELSVTIASLEHVHTVEYDYPSFHLSMECFFCQIAEGTIHDHEHENLRWLTKDELNDVAWLPADKGIIPTLKKLLP